MTVDGEEQQQIAALERQAAAVLTTVRQAVDVLKPSARKRSKASAPLFSPDQVYHQLKKLDIVALIETWQRLEPSLLVLVASQSLDNRLSDYSFWKDWQPPVAQNDDENDDSNSLLREKLVHQVLWPLLELLGLVYTYLDALPTPSPPPKQSTSRNKPPPPPGLLSLQDYTNVAALLEFVVGVSLVPLLDAHVVAVWPRPVPQAVRGRLSPAALTVFGKKETINSNTTASISHGWYEVQGTAARLAYVLQLDRFRPMLLPRHVVDLHAAYWQTRHWWTQLHSNSHSLYDDNAASSLRESQVTHGQWYLNTWRSLWPDTTTSIMDDTLLAATCQKLLHHGRQAPAWLQRSVGTTLQAIAHRNLAAVRTVFAGDDSAAALRLARTLVAGPRQVYKAANVVNDSKSHDSKVKDMTAFDPLVAQICILLDQVVASTATEDSKSLDMATASWTQAHHSQIQFAWALLEQFPLSVLKNSVLPAFYGDTENSDMHQFVRRWTALFLWIPPFVNLSRWSQTLWTVPVVLAPNVQAPVLQLLWNLASTPHVVQSSVQNDATYAVQLWSQAVLAASWKGSNALDVFALFLLHILRPITDSYEFAISPNNKGLDRVTLSAMASPARVDVVAGTHTAHQLVQLERRAEFAVEKLILPLSQESVAKENTGLPGRLLQILVVLYLSMDPFDSTKAALLPKTLLTPELALVTMTLLPVLCEKCSLEKLLADPSSSVPLLNLIGLVLKTVSLQIDNSSSTASSSSETRPLAEIDSAAKILQEMMLSSHDDGTLKDNQLAMFGDEDARLSMASVLLTLLVGILELGSKSRTSEEESALQVLSPALLQLSQVSTDETFDNTSARLLSELAEMASHANALIAARSATSVAKSAPGDEVDTITGQFLQAKQDLASKEPPMRARGVVTLRHLAYVTDKPTETILIEDATARSEITLSDITSVAIDALADAESYVYLAAIQTITAAAVQDPVRIVRQLCTALAKGDFPSEESSRNRLSAEQRVKLAEALIAFVRRTASLAKHLDDIFGTLLYTSKGSGHSTSNEEMNLIQVETHRYFVGRKEQEDVDDGEDWEETKLRVNTGGPVFDTEENDLVRSASINLVAEVVRLSPPAVTSRFVPTLVDCAKLSLQLDSSRPVRRSGALLASSLYTAVLHEIEEQDPEMLAKQKLECPLTLALVAHDETSLLSSLTRAAKGEDLSDLSQDRLFDPATVARCREALTTRDTIEATGVLDLATLAITSQSDVPNILRVQSPSGKGAKPLLSVVQEP